MSLWDSPPLVVAASRMSGVRCYLDVDPDRLRDALRPLGPVELLGPPGRQLCCELWYVTDGRVLVGGLEQDEWAMVAGELARGTAGFWGACGGWARGMLSVPGGGSPGGEAAPPGDGSGKPPPTGPGSQWLGAMETAMRYGRAAAEAWGDYAHRQTTDLTRWTVIDPYHELLLSVPDVMYPGCEEPVSVALGMATDSDLAFRLDRLSFYGYDKRMARFSTDRARQWEVTIGGQPVLRAHFAPTGRDERDFNRSEAASGTIQPLLGGIRDRRPMLAELRRDLFASGDGLHEVEGGVEFAQELFPLMEPGIHRVESRNAPPSRISVGFERLQTWVTYPRSPEPVRGPGGPPGTAP